MSMTAKERADKLGEMWHWQDREVAMVEVELRAHANAALEAAELLARKQGCWCARLAEQPHGSVPHCGLNPCPHTIADAIRALREEE